MAPKRVSKVFVAGGQPTVTYVDRKSLKLEDNLKDLIETGYALISVTGATKSGKTVLCRNVIKTDSAIWIGGGEISSENEFWDRIASELGAHAEESESAQLTRVDGVQKQTSGSVGVPFAKISGAETAIDSKQSARTQTRVKKTTPKSLALSLLDECGKIIVIDDFHYIESNLQKTIVRALKQKIFDGLIVVVLAVPHRAYDAVKVETEMTGRVKHLNIPKWELTELTEIAKKGFSDLLLSCDASIVDELASQAFASPHLMQWFCQKLCSVNGITQSSDEEKILTLSDKQSFFGEVAKNTAKPAFDRLAIGPRQRTDRIIRKFSDGTEGDIYIAILKAIAATGPKLTMTYEDVRARMKDLIANDIPQAHEISRVLVKMTEIAKEKIDGEPVIEWEEEVLHIIDPFFAFYLRWGVLERPGTN